MKEKEVLKINKLNLIKKTIKKKMKKLKQKLIQFFIIKKIKEFKIFF